MSARWRGSGAVGVLVLLVLALLPAGSRAEEPVKVLSLREAQAIALEQNRDIEKAVAYRQWVEGKYLEERSAALPQATLRASGSRQVDESLLDLYGELAEFLPTSQDFSMGELSVSQPIFHWGKLGAAIRAATVGKLTADDQLRVAQQAALLAVTAAFDDVLLARELAGIAAENLVMKDRHLDEARRKFELGTATDFDVLAAQVSVQNARPLAIRTENSVRTARDRLRFLLAEEALLDAAGTLEVEPEPLPSYEEAFANALEYRPDLSNLEHLAGVQREVVKIARSQNKPEVDFRVSYGYRRYDLADIDSSGPAWSAGVYVSFPFFDGWRTKGLTLQARSDLTQIEVDAAKLRDSISLEVRTALNAVRESEEIVKGLEGNVQQAERLLFMAERGFEYGVKTRLDVEDAQLSVLQAKGNLAQAHRDYLVARTALDWVMGILGEV